LSLFEHTSASAPLGEVKKSTAFVMPLSSWVTREDKELVIRRHLGDGGTQPVQRCGVEIQVDVVFILRHSFLAVPIPGVLQPGPGNSLDVPAVLKLA
jgi:hypothetical protein